MPEPRKDKAARKAAANDAEAGSNPVLLIVEDDLGLQKQLKWAFEGYTVVFAADRNEAIVQLRRHEPSVVLQDLGLPPDGDGVTEGF